MREADWYSMIEYCLENIEVCVQRIPDRYTLNILFNLQSVSNGAFNQIVDFFCGDPVSFLRHPEYLRDVIVYSVL